MFELSYVIKKFPIVKLEGETIYYVGNWFETNYRTCSNNQKHLSLSCKNDSDAWSIVR